MEAFVTIPDGNVTSPIGYQAAAVASGLKSSGALDLALVVSDLACTAAAVFTRNQVAAAPVIVDRETVERNPSTMRGVVANAGNANACTGRPGLANAREMQRLAAEMLNLRPDQMLVLSTGVIGVQLPMDKIRAGIQAAATTVSRQHGDVAAEAIMTTDSRPKQVAVRVNLNGDVFTIGGMAKGAGMIHPNMATMLSVLTTDAAVRPQTLQRALRRAVDASFNRISVDGDTSTNDTVLLLANGASGSGVSDEHDEEIFAKALLYVCDHLAKMIVRDGEGATKFVEIQVSGCRNDTEALAIVQTVATSPLVKTAFAGGDANWGRILAAAGRAGVVFDQSKVGLWIGAHEAMELKLVEDGTPTAYRESEAAAIFAGAEFIIRLDFDQGEASSTMWTSDLTGEYVKINADYRT